MNIHGSDQFTGLILMVLTKTVNSSFQVGLTAGDFILDRFYFRKEASGMDVRKTLAGVRMMRLVLTCSQVERIPLNLFACCDFCFFSSLIL